MKVTYLTSGGNEHSWFKAYIETAIKYLIAKNVEISTSGSQGGYHSVFEPKNDAPPRLEYLISCGSFPDEKKEAYLYYSFEKAIRLNANIYTLGHKTSRESANNVIKEYRGSYYSEDDNRIFSFSGLKALWDEFLDVMQSCFSSYLKSKGEMDSKEILKLFKKRAADIEATDEQLQIMYDTVQYVINEEINKEL